MSLTYAILALTAIGLLFGYFIFVNKREKWLLLLFISVAVVNMGYFWLSVANRLEFAILANDIVYFGSVFLSMSMFLSIMDLCGFHIRKRLVATLAAVGALMFAIVATVGFLPWYYREVSLVFVDGAAKLKKVYGVLHPTYLVYLIGYFAAMIICIVRSMRKKRIASQKCAVLLAAIVFGNIAVWFVEKFVPWDFEFLALSYLFSEIVLLGIYWMMEDYVPAEFVAQAQTTSEFVRIAEPVDIAVMSLEDKILKVLSFLKEGEILAVREREILGMVLQNKKRKEIADELCLSENTIKTYTRTLYGKIGVSSREELFALLVK